MGLPSWLHWLAGSGAVPTDVLPAAELVEQHYRRRFRPADGSPVDRTNSCGSGGGGAGAELEADEPEFDARAVAWLEALERWHRNSTRGTVGAGVTD